VTSSLRADSSVLESSGNTLASSPVSLVPTSLPTDQVILPEVVVTANRLEIPLQDITSSSSVITASDIEQKQAGTVQDAVQGLPGVDITQEGNPGEISSVFIRGMASEFTLVLFDGIPLNDPVGTTSDFEFLDGLSLDG